MSEDVGSVIGERRRRRGGTRTPVLFSIAAAVLAIDIVSKVLVVAEMTPGKPVPVIGDEIRFALIRNSGAAFSLATGKTWVLTLIAFAVVAGIIRYGRGLTSAWWAAGLGLVLGGAVGNLVDRMLRAPGPLEGHVVDFIAVGSFPVFNLADSGITVGAVLLVGLALFGVEPHVERAPEHTAATDQDGSATQAGPPSPSDANSTADPGTADPTATADGPAHPATEPDSDEERQDGSHDD